MKVRRETAQTPAKRALGAATPRGVLERCVEWRSVETAMQNRLSLQQLWKIAPLFTTLWVLNPAASGTGPMPEKTVPQIFEGQGKAVIVVSNLASGMVLQKFGTGFLIKPNGVFVTNFHVVKGANAVSIKLSDKREFPITGVVAVNPDLDLAILKIEADTLPVVTLGDSDTVKVGDRILAIGSPMGLESTLSDGLVSAIREGDSPGEGKIFQITAPVSPGSSGGVLLNMKGEVIGVTSAQLTEGQNLNFAIPINYAKQLIRDGRIEPFSPRALLPTEQDCPVIGNEKSGIYHLPGGQFYNQMRVSPNGVCFQTEEAAGQAGFRRSAR